MKKLRSLFDLRLLYCFMIIAVSLSSGIVAKSYSTLYT